MIGDGIERLLAEPQPFCLHTRSHHGVGFSGAHNVGQKRVGRLQDAPNGCLLVRPKGDNRTGSRQREMGSVESADSYVVEFLVVFRDEAQAALVVLPDPLPKPFLDLLLLLASGFRGRGVDNPLIGFGVHVVNGRCPQIQGVLHEVDSAVTRRTPFCGIADRTLGTVIGL